MEGVGIEKIVKKLQLKKYIEDMELKDTASDLRM